MTSDQTIANKLPLIDFDCTDYLTEFCLNEIALQGLEGKKYYQKKI
jgi:hypothetical protein